MPPDSRLLVAILAAAILHPTSADPEQQQPCRDGGDGRNNIWPCFPPDNTSPWYKKCQSTNASIAFFAAHGVHLDTYYTTSIHLPSSCPDCLTGQQRNFAVDNVATAELISPGANVIGSYYCDKPSDMCVETLDGRRFKGVPPAHGNSNLYITVFPSCRGRTCIARLIVDGDATQRDVWADLGLQQINGAALYTARGSYDNRTTNGFWSEDDYNYLTLRGVSCNSCSSPLYYCDAFSPFQPSAGLNFEGRRPETTKSPSGNTDFSRGKDDRHKAELSKRKYSGERAAPSSRGSKVVDASVELTTMAATFSSRRPSRAGPRGNYRNHEDERKSTKSKEYDVQSPPIRQRRPAVVKLLDGGDDGKTGKQQARLSRTSADGDDADRRHHHIRHRHHHHSRRNQTALTTIPPSEQRRHKPHRHHHRRPFPATTTSTLPTTTDGEHYNPSEFEGDDVIKMDTRRRHKSRHRTKTAKSPEDPTTTEESRKYRHRDAEVDEPETKKKHQRSIEPADEHDRREREKHRRKSVTQIENKTTRIKERQEKRGERHRKREEKREERRRHRDKNTETTAAPPTTDSPITDWPINSWPINTLRTTTQQDIITTTRKDSAEDDVARSPSRPPPLNPAARARAVYRQPRPALETNNHDDRSSEQQPSVAEDPPAVRPNRPAQSRLATWNPEEDEQREERPGNEDNNKSGKSSKKRDDSDVVKKDDDDDDDNDGNKSIRHSSKQHPEKSRPQRRHHHRHRKEKQDVEEPAVSGSASRAFKESSSDDDDDDGDKAGWPHRRHKSHSTQTKSDEDKEEKQTDGDAE